MIYAVYADGYTPRFREVKSKKEADELFQELFKQGMQPLGYVNDTKGYKVKVAREYFGGRAGLTSEMEEDYVREQIDNGYAFISGNKKRYE